MGKTLYLDCTCGISGDMTVAALLDLGAREEVLRAALDSLPVEGYEVKIGRVFKAGLDCCDFDVVLDPGFENHDHDMAYLHGRDDGHAHGHDHTHAHGHSHDRTHAHHHAHRGPADIDAIIDAGEMTPRARALAHRIVDVIARAEAKAHGVPLDEVHFHEVGAVDSIVDIVSTAVAIDDLDIDRVIVPVLKDGHGTIRCEHGVIPVPVPATLNIVEAHGLPLSVCDVEGELVTPTGAAIVAALEAERELPERFCVKAVGLGAGKRTYERPSLVRALIIEELPGGVSDLAWHPQDGAERVSAASPYNLHSAALAGEVKSRGGELAEGDAPHPTIDAAMPASIVRLECDIDDASGEVLAYAAERLREAGAREVHWVPIFTKKGRPAWQLQVIAAIEDAERLEGIIFSETTTIGIRRWLCDRTVLERAWTTVPTPWGEVRMKVVTLPDGSLRGMPEYEDVAAIARRERLSFQTVMAAARSSWSA